MDTQINVGSGLTAPDNLSFPKWVAVVLVVATCNAWV